MKRSKKFMSYLGITGSFLMGVVLFWWGLNIVAFHWVDIRTAYGPIVGNMILAPLLVGFVIASMAISSLVNQLTSK